MCCFALQMQLVTFVRLLHANELVEVSQEMWSISVLMIRVLVGRLVHLYPPGALLFVCWVPW